MAVLSVQEIVLGGLNPAYSTAAGGGDTCVFPTDGKSLFLHVKNGGGAPINVTLNSLENCNQGFDHDNVVSVPNAGERMIRVDKRFRQTSGDIAITYSGVTSVTIACLKV